ncbi:MAG: hypothetical protein EB127_31140, partial [Alphaproteobacteria bacterium]|nr:hypothetical protein [Alphaproteobacteria bacterium]
FLTYSSGSSNYFKPNAKLRMASNASEEDRNLLEEEYLQQLSSGINREKLKKQWDFSWDTSLMGDRVKPSDMPPFDIVILMVNELGQIGKIILYGVELIHDSQTLSIEDIYTEAQYQYIARDIEYFHATNFDETFSWKATTPDYKIVKPKEVTGEDKIAETPPKPIEWKKFSVSASTLVDDNFVRDQILNAEESSVIAQWQAYKTIPNGLTEEDLFYNRLELPGYDPNMPFFAPYTTIPTGLPQEDAFYNMLEHPSYSPWDKVKADRAWSTDYDATYNSLEAPGDYYERKALDSVKEDIRARGLQPPPDWVLLMQRGK